MEPLDFNTEPMRVNGNTPTMRHLGGHALANGRGKSSYSCDTANCVEAGVFETTNGGPLEVVTGDSKTPGIELHFNPDAWRGFVEAVRQDRFTQ